jgi:Mrp family chromosome partitioning ATPase
MARIRDALRKADFLRGQSTQAVLSLCPAQSLSESEGEEVPFIEVGGKNQPLLASASVLAATPPLPPAKSIPVEPARTNPVTVQALVTPTRLEPVRVTFQPLGGECRSPRPPVERFAPELVVFHQPAHPASAGFRHAAAEIAAQLPVGPPQVLLFTAATPRIDTAITLVNIALAQSERGPAPQVVVDANVRQPALAYLLGLPQVPGLCEVLTGTILLPRALQETGLPDLHVLTAGKSPDSPTSLAVAEAWRAVLRHLRLRYERVLIAAPHWDGRPELVALGSACDAVYLVAAQNDADTAQVTELCQLIPQQGIRLRGCIHVAA